MTQFEWIQQNQIFKDGWEGKNIKAKDRSFELNPLSRWEETGYFSRKGSDRLLNNLQRVVVLKYG